MAYESFRQTIVETDRSQFFRPSNLQNGAFNIRSRKGPDFPVLCQSQDDFIKWFGTPDGEFWGGYEVMNYLNEAPAYVTSSIGSGALHSGVDIRTASVKSFGVTTGRNPLSFDLASISSQVVYKSTPPTSGNGIISEFIGIDFASVVPETATIADLVANPTHFKIKVGNQYITDLTFGAPVANVYPLLSASLDASDSKLTVLPAADPDPAEYTLDLKFLGTPGTPAQYTGSVDVVTAPINLSGPKNKAFNLSIDGNLLTNIDLGNAPITGANLVTAINDALDDASIGNNLVSLSSNFLRINGIIGDSLFGKIVISAPTDFTTYDNAIPLIFDATYIGGSITQTVEATDPPLASSIPRNGREISLEITITEDLTEEVAFSLMSASPIDPKFEYYVETTYVRDRIYNTVLTEKTDRGFIQLKSYNYSLDKIKNSQGKSIYIFDIFKNDPYLKPVVNPAYTGIATLQGFSGNIPLTGGNRGSAPSALSIYQSWSPFRKASRYNIKTFVDIYGDSAGTIRELTSTYQPYAFGITCVPLGYSVFDAISFRQGLGIDFDNMALYTNWCLIEDLYGGGGTIFTSGMGQVAVKFAQMATAFDAESPAGVDFNGFGGQLQGAFRILSTEQEYTSNDLRLLDQAQINPIVFDDDYGPRIVGDRTLKVDESDTSFIGTRRLYNYILGNIKRRVLTRQEFRLNDEVRRELMKSLCEDVVNPVLDAGFLREARVICDESNNTDEVLNLRRFVIDIYVKVTPNTQEILLNFIRLSQTQSIESVIGTV